MRDTFQVLRWCASLGRKFTIVVPWATLSVVLSTLVSQVAILMATFLPLKIVILLGSEGVPRYFPPSFANIDRDLLVGLLSAAAASAYLAYVVVERVIKFSSERGARRLLERSHKLLLFENQDKIAADAYQRYARALASGVFVGLVFLVLTLVYRDMAVVLAAYIVLAVVAFHLAASVSRDSRLRLVDNLQVRASVTGNIGFLVGFAWLVVDFLFYSPPSLLPAVVSLLLSRLALMRLAGLVADVAALRKQQSKLDALFFHDKAFLPVTTEHEQTIWPLLDPERRIEWAADLLKGFDSTERPILTSKSLQWFQLRVPQCVALTTDLTSSRKVLIKLFDRTRQGMARHEAELLTSSVSGLPAPEWLGVGSVDGRSCHLMALGDNAESLPTTRFMKHKLKVVQGLLAVVPPSRLVQRYRRSRSQLYQRIEPAWFERVAVAADEKCADQVKRIRAMTGAIQDKLRNLPSCIVNPDIVPQHLLLIENRVCVVHWGDWRIEPVGCGWPVESSALNDIDASLAYAAQVRSELEDVSPDVVRLAALMYALERNLWLTRLSEALQLIPELEQCLSALEISETSIIQEP